MVAALRRKSRHILAASLVLVTGLAVCTLATCCQATHQPVDAPARTALDSFPWLYRRDGMEDPGEPVEIIAVGDILLGRGVQAPERAFELSAPWLQSADLTLGNLECVLVSSPITPTTTLEHSFPAPVRLYADPLAADWLRDAGFDVLGLANNHALDAGLAGLAESAGHLRAAGLETIGAGENKAAALEPYYTTIQGIRLAFLSINAIPVPAGTGQPAASETGGLDIARWERSAVQAAVQQARSQADVVIVSIHWGYEYQTRTDPAQERLGEVLLAAGADVVIGHHPHVVQAPEIQPGEDGRTALVAYSLGNFVFDQGQDATGQGLALRLLVDREGLRAAQAIPVLAGSQPRLQPPESTPGSETPTSTAAFTCTALGCTALDEAPCTTQSGLFDTGRADLDADGILEEIRLEGGRLAILHAGSVAWRSPESWLVVDAALGDPDQDGRTDLVAIFWKADRAGVLRSHPFLIRSEGGRYQEVWGGSAVSEPILEAAVGDLDGDGLDELAVLEQAPGGQSLSVWRWHGWGFSQLWRSAPGNYQDLSLVAKGSCGQDGDGMLILASLNR